MDNREQDNFMDGFVAKCAELGVDPVACANKMAEYEKAAQYSDYDEEEASDYENQKPHYRDQGRFRPALGLRGLKEYRIPIGEESSVNAFNAAKLLTSILQMRGAQRV